MKRSKFRSIHYPLPTIHYPLSTAHYSLRRYPISITRVERGFTHIAQAENLSRQTLKTDSQAAVWWHSELEHFEMALKTARVYAASTQRRVEVFSAMQSLSAGGYLNSMKQEVKALRRFRRPFRSAWRGVKRAAGERVSNYKYRRDPSLLLHKSAQLPFPLRVEVICQIRSAEVLFQKFEASAELPDWDSEH